MPITSTRVSFGLYALALKQDSTPTCSDVQSFSKVNDLKTGNVTSKPYATYEPNYWLLNGNYKFKPVDDTIVHVGLWSLSQSDAAGDFSVPPELTITFGSVQSSDGLTLRFSSVTNDYAAEINVAYYDDSDILIRDDDYFPSSWEFSTGRAVTNFKKIIITFRTVNKAYRYLRVTGIDFGELIYFENTDIKSASVVQQVNPISIELPIDTLDLVVYSDDAQFSIVDPAGDYTALQNKQPLDVYETVENEIKYIGQFYLSDWKNQALNEIKFEAVDRLGVLDGLTYYGGIWTAAVDVEDLIDDILTAVNAPYELDTDLYGTQIKGWLPICTYREALQQIAFVIGAYITCSRAGVLQILKTTLASDVVSQEYTITRAQKGIDQSLSLKTFVTGVEVTAHNYITNATTVNLFNGTLAAGTHTITFSSPKRNLTPTGATITESGANYAILNVASPGTVTLTGQGYDDTTRVVGVHNGTLDATTPQNILSINDATLVNPDNVAVITQRVYDYYQQRYLQKVKLYAPDAEPGRSVLIDTYSEKQIAGVVEKMEIDLSGGMVSKTEIVGVIAS